MTDQKIRQYHRCALTDARIEVGDVVHSLDWPRRAVPLKIIADFGELLETEDHEVWENVGEDGGPHLYIVKKHD